MAKQQLRMTCKNCGQRRVKALVTHPITSKKRRTPVKLCQECHIKTIDYHFFKSNFGQWLRRAFQRQCTNSIPKHTQELRELLHLWRFHKKACGFSSDGEEVVKTFDYHLCHIDPVKGEMGYVGRLVAQNLIIAPAKLNRELSNLPYPFTRKHSVSQGEPITDDIFVSLCRERYDLTLLIAEFCLTAVKHSKVLPIFKSDGTAPNQVLSMELRRLGYTHCHLISDDEYCQKVDDVFDTFFKVGGVLAVNFLMQHGETCDGHLFDYDLTLPYDQLRANVARKKERLKHVDF
jgi:hypothetical protein